MGLRIGPWLAAVSLATLAGASQGSAAVAAEVGFTAAELQAAGDGTARLRRALSAEGILRHQRKLAGYARRYGNTRASGTPGYNQTSRYVRRKLRAAGYDVQVQFFDYDEFVETAPPTLARATPDQRTFAADIEFRSLEYSGAGAVTGRLVPTTDIQVPPAAEPGSTSGCEAADFPAPPAANAVALIQRGTCTFADKVNNAAAAGYAAAIVFNEGQPGREELVNGTLGEEVAIPAVGTSFAVGEELYENAQGSQVTVSLSVTARVDTEQTNNVIADSPRGRPDRVIVVGAHLDSVPEGPGINDNGSGASTILEMALEIARIGLPQRNKLRFAFWGAEESGLIGSTFYVENLPGAELARIEANLNFDMLASPNFVRFVYDGDGSLTPDDPPLGPPGSAAIERLFGWYFGTRQGLATEPTAFDGRSDYGPFIAVGIPAGGLFSGAEGVKTPEEARVYGGRAGEAYDACYHQPCDTYRNQSLVALDQLGDGAAYATMALANRVDPLVPQAAKAKATAQATARAGTSAMVYRGPKLQR